MDESSGNQASPASVDQSPQGVQTPPAPNSVQPPVQPPQTTQTSFQQSTMNQQPEVVQPTAEAKPKSGKKKILIMLVGLVVLLALVIIGVFVLLTPTVKGLSACMEESSKNMDALFQRGLEEKWTNQQKCQEFKPETEKLIACYERVGSNSLLPEQLAFTLGGILRGKELKVDKEGLIQLHNTNCSQYTETIIAK